MKDCLGAGALLATPVRFGCLVPARIGVNLPPIRLDGSRFSVNGILTVNGRLAWYAAQCRMLRSLRQRPQFLRSSSALSSSFGCRGAYAPSPLGQFSYFS